MRVLYGVAIALLVGLAAHWLCPSKRREARWFAIAALLTFPAPILCLAIALMLSAAVPQKLDLYAYTVDSWLGFQPSFALGEFLQRHSLLDAMQRWAYADLPLVILVVFGLCVALTPTAHAAFAARAFLWNLVCAPPLYLAIPVCGPKYAFPTFPDLPAAVHPARIALDAAPNGIPSVHMSSAILILCFLWRWKAGRVFGPVFLCLTVIATLGSGEHYFVDLAAAVPYTALVLRLARVTSRAANRTSATGPQVRAVSSGGNG